MTAGAKRLLYGPRRLGPGPQLSGDIIFEKIVNELFAGDIPPSWLSLLPGIEIVSDPYRAQGRTVVYLAGIAEHVLTVSFWQDGGENIIFLDYSNYRDGAPTPAGIAEQRLLDHLAFSLDHVAVEFSCPLSGQLKMLISSYDNLRLAPPEIDQQMSEDEILSNLADNGDYLDRTSRNLLKETPSLQDLLKNPEGEKALIEAARSEDIYFRRDLALFKQ